MIMEPKNNKNYLIIVVVLVVALGLAAGVVGEMLARSYLYGFYGMPLVNDVNFSDSNRSNLVIREAKKVVVEQNDKVSETANAVSSSIVGIYRKKGPDQSKNTALEEYYAIGSADGQGLVITSDGWIVTSFPGFSGKPTSHNDFVVVTKDKKIYPIDKSVQDKISQFYFIHIPAKDLAVRNFSDQDRLKNGQLVLSVNWSSASFLNSVVNSQKSTEAVRNSDSLDEVIELALPMTKAVRGQALFDLAGDVIGLINEEGKIEGAGHFSSVINSLFKSKEAKRPSFGANYADLGGLVSSKQDSNNKVAGLPDKGALIVKNSKGVAVTKGSVADLAGFKEGDVIVSVQNIELDQVTSLTDAIERFAPGDEVTIAFLRDGKKSEIEVRLGQIK